jgi:hypothetical protein
MAPQRSGFEEKKDMDRLQYHLRLVGDLRQMAKDEHMPHLAPLIDQVYDEIAKVRTACITNASVQEFDRFRMPMRSVDLDSRLHKLAELQAQRRGE